MKRFTRLANSPLDCKSLKEDLYSGGVYVAIPQSILRVIEIREKINRLHRAYSEVSMNPTLNTISK